MFNLLITITIIFSLLLAWILIQQAARKYAANHPELGPVKEEGLGCGKTCGCKKGSCDQKN
ncbi:MAG: hypothetical protein L3J59_04080 [Methylococcaceae bacterium]|nr:hypothetical protein [Methylococcaceae bacterium]